MYTVVLDGFLVEKSLNFAKDWKEKAPEKSTLRLRFYHKVRFIVNTHTQQVVTAMHAFLICFSE